jgi:hypothetical protein
VSNSRIPVKLTVDTGYSPVFERYGYIREVNDRAIILDTPAAERFASSQIPLASVVDLEDATAEQVEANPRGTLGATSRPRRSWTT